MTRTSRHLTMGFIVTLGLAGVGRTASADRTEPLTIALWVHDTAQVPDAVLTRAQAEVTGIYRQAGVEIMWRASSSSSVDTDADRESRLTIAILSYDQAKRLSPELIRDAVGVALSSATSRSHVAYVFYHRVENLTGGNGFNLAPVLAIAMAHEVGHLLLPYSSHSMTGLMRAKWTKADLQLAQRGLLFFTAEQAKLIRSRMAASRQQ